MRRGLLLSIFIHAVLLFIMVASVPEFLFPKPEVKAIQVRLLTVEQLKETAKEQEKQVAKLEKIRTQQSAAPRYAPKKVSKQPQRPLIERPVVVSSDLEIKQNPKAQNQEEAQPATAKSDFRPPKLDKTKGKKQVVKNDLTDEEVKVVEKADDFLKALEFINQLKYKEAKKIDGEKSQTDKIDIAEQAEIAVIKKHIERNWYKTPGTKAGLTIQMRLRLNRDGTLQDMETIKSSGSISFDKSLERAVRKSIPLPLPVDNYELFKEIDLYWNG